MDVIQRAFPQTLLALVALLSYLEGPCSAQSTTRVVVAKQCSRCGKSVPLSSEVGQTCPHCGVRWAYSSEKDGNGISLGAVVVLGSVVVGAAALLAAWKALSVTGGMFCAFKDAVGDRSGVLTICCALLVLGLAVTSLLPARRQGPAALHTPPPPATPGLVDKPQPNDAAALPAADDHQRSAREGTDRRNEAPWAGDTAPPRASTDSPVDRSQPRRQRPIEPRPVGTTVAAEHSKRSPTMSTESPPRDPGTPARSEQAPPPEQTPASEEIAQLASAKWDEARKTGSLKLALEVVELAPASVAGRQAQLVVDKATRWAAERRQKMLDAVAGDDPRTALLLAHEILDTVPDFPAARDARNLFASARAKHALLLQLETRYRRAGDDAKADAYRQQARLWQFSASPNRLPAAPRNTTPAGAHRK